MNSDEHMGQICECACIGLLMWDLQSSFVSVSAWHSCIPQGGGHPVSVSKADSDQLCCPFYEGETRGKEKERIDKAISWFGKGIKGIQLNWACTERRKSNMGSSSILVPSTVIQAFHYQPWEDFVSHKLLSAPVFFSKQCQCSTFYILLMLPYKVLFGRSWALLLKCSWWYCSCK